jgi:hypothetical protein
MRHDEDHDGGGSPWGETTKTTSARHRKTSRKVHLARPFLSHSKTCVRHREALSSVQDRSFARPSDLAGVLQKEASSRIFLLHIALRRPFFTVSATCTLSPQ